MNSHESNRSKDYLVTPEVGQGPGILVLHSGRGLTKFTRQLCIRLAREGFVAHAPDLFHGKTPKTKGEALEAKASIDERSMINRLEDTAVFIRKHRGVSHNSIGVIGLGYGAENACRLAPSITDTSSNIVLFYGYRETAWGDVDTPLLGHFAALDHEIPESRVNEIRSILTANDVPHDLFEYPFTEPSFFETDSTARHHPEAAQLAWERTLQFLKQTLLNY